VALFLAPALVVPWSAIDGRLLIWLGNGKRATAPALPWIPLAGRGLIVTICH
jgi:hypothetical protein